jgi:hypothetical protein
MKLNLTGISSRHSNFRWQEAPREGRFYPWIGKESFNKNNL